MADKPLIDELAYTMRLFRQLRSPAKRKFQMLVRNSIKNFDYRWNVLAEVGLWDEAIYAFVRQQRRSNCYMSDVSNRLRSFMEVEGATDIEVAPNLILWTNASASLASSINRLLAGGKLQLVCDEHDPAVFAKKAGYHFSKLPPVNRIPSGGYPTPHWLLARLA